MDIDAVLRRFSQKQVSVDEVMRALVSYDAWVGPASWAAEAFATTVFDQAYALGSTPKVPRGEFWLFTSEEAASRAAASGLAPGLYVAPLRGSLVFERLPNGIETLKVNPGSPSEAGWIMGAKAMPLCGAWARAITLERKIESGEPVALALGMHPEFGVLVSANGGLVSAKGAAGMQNPGLIFSAADCMNAGASRIAGGDALRRGVIPGPTLFKDLAGLGVDGYILNFAGVGPTRAFDRELCKGIAELVASATRT